MPWCAVVRLVIRLFLTSGGFPYSCIAAELAQLTPWPWLSCCKLAPAVLAPALVLRGSPCSLVIQQWTHFHPSLAIPIQTRWSHLLHLPTAWFKMKHWRDCTACDGIKSHHLNVWQLLLCVMECFLLPHEPMGTVSYFLQTVSEWVCDVQLSSHIHYRIFFDFFSAYYDQLTVQKIVLITFVFQFSHSSTFLIWPLQKLSIILPEDFFNCDHVSSLTLLYRYLPCTNPSPSIGWQPVASRVGGFIIPPMSQAHITDQGQLGSKACSAAAGMFLALISCLTEIGCCP